MINEQLFDLLAQLLVLGLAIILSISRLKIPGAYKRWLERVPGINFEDDEKVEINSDVNLLEIKSQLSEVNQRLGVNTGYLMVLLLVNREDVENATNTSVEKLTQGDQILRYIEGIGDGAFLNNLRKTSS